MLVLLACSSAEGREVKRDSGKEGEKEERGLAQGDLLRVHSTVIQVLMHGMD